MPSRDSMSRCYFLVVLTIGIGVNWASAQSGTASFSSSSLPVHATVSALGGVNASRADRDVAYFFNNPSLVSDTLDQWVSFSHLFYFANIGFSTFAFQQNFGKVGSLNFGVSHLELGSIQGYDAVGNPIGKFESGESAIVIGKSHEVGLFSLGVNLKMYFSNLTGYRSNALGIDLGGTFRHPHKDLNVGLVFKNIGLVLSDYSPTSSSSLPFDIQTGITFKPEHMPVRFSFTIDNLTDYNLPRSVGQSDDGVSALDKAISHITFGGELLLHKNVNVLLGYNFLRHKELKLDEAGGGSGFAIGVTAVLRNLNLSLSRAGYVTGGAYHVSLGLNTAKMLKKR